MKVNFTTKALALNGEPLKERGEEIWLNKTLAGVIMMQEAKDNTTMQKFELATKLFSAQGEIEITESEKVIIKEVCEKGGMMVLLAAQILLLLNNAN